MTRSRGIKRPDIYFIRDLELFEELKVGEFQVRI